MMDIFNTLGGMGQAQNTIGQQLGTSPQQTEAALEAAVPLLLGALGRNAQDPHGAQALAGALGQHDGSALDLFGQGQAPDPFQGQRILGHVFGGQQYAAANAVSRRAGIDPALAMQLLAMVAPLVMGYLGRRQQGQAGGMGGGLPGGLGNAGGGLDIGSILGGLLGGGTGGGLGGVLGGMLGGGQPQVQPSPYQDQTYQDQSSPPSPYQEQGQDQYTQSRGGGLGGPVLPGYRSSPEGQGYGQPGYSDQTAGQVGYTDQGGLSQGPFGQPGHAGTGQMGGMGGMIGTLNNVLDRDGDGNALDDLIGMFGGNRR